MKHLIGFFSICIFIAGCDSPQNHRIREAAHTASEAQTLYFSTQELSVRVQWLVGPIGNINTNNHLLVIFTDASGTPQSLPNGISLGFYSTMPSMGHPMDDAGFFEKISDGIYLNKTIRYNMPGDWQNELWLMDSQLNIQEKVLWNEFF